MLPIQQIPGGSEEVYSQSPIIHKGFVSGVTGFMRIDPFMYAGGITGDNVEGGLHGMIDEE